MILTDYFYPEYDASWEYAKECGVEHGVLRLPETADFDITSCDHWNTVVNRMKSFGIRPLVIEPLPNSVHDHIKLGDDKRDQSIEKAIGMLAVMDRLDIRILCFNFMAGIGWFRTSNNLAERGKALVTGFNIDDFAGSKISVTEQQLWDNYEYFIRAIMPHAEKHGIKLALHPDDPPVSPLGNVSRIMVSYSNIVRALRTGNSPFLGLTMCQANYYLMGEDLFSIIPKLRDKIFYVHFRNVTGNKYRFRETFHDNGDLPMGKLIRLYKELNIDVPIRVDHVPAMAEETSGMPGGYGFIGRLFAIGYLKGLLEGQ
ncbi:mannonate dehydratase [Spirochaetia bacterium]|nr:mannonate dehydratase [Spirochaetia bacterium]